MLLSVETPFMVARHKNKPPFVVHYLVEIILELVEDRLFGLLVTLEVLAVAQAFDGFVLFLCESLRYKYADVDNQIACSLAVALNSGESFST